MLDSVFQFVLTVPVENPLLRALIMVAETLGMGIALYWWWEMVPRLASAIARVAKAAIGSGMAHRDEARAGALR
ncbi:MAG: hypothetical protein ABIH46_09680 [Chloroflexota bacterium]